MVDDKPTISQLQVNATIAVVSFMFLINRLDFRFDSLVLIGFIQLLDLVIIA